MGTLSSKDHISGLHARPRLGAPSGVCVCEGWLSCPEPLPGLRVKRIHYLPHPGPLQRIFLNKGAILGSLIVKVSLGLQRPGVGTVGEA